MTKLILNKKKTFFFVFLQKDKHKRLNELVWNFGSKDMETSIRTIFPRHWDLMWMFFYATLMNVQFIEIILLI